jgi:hypothetical protein
VGIHLLQADDSISGYYDGMTLVLEDVPNRGSDAGLVVDYENGRHLALPSKRLLENPRVFCEIARITAVSKKPRSFSDTLAFPGVIYPSADRYRT